MKSRSWILLLMILFLACPLFADEEPIDMDEEPSTDSWNRGDRSINYCPFVSHDGDILYIYSEVPLVGLRVTVKDMNGMVVYSNVLSITGGDKVVLDLYVVGGEFLLILNDNSRCLYGIFSLT